ncbi:MAG TPA: AAA family ATPase [Lachnospiraceae bacterium]|nr:ATP-binding protein [Acutalibacteraceae bacterium]HCE77879.1 AAA family ATPase [Lachnospiraceae bacterium]
MKESATLEFKEKITNTFQKTVSAFANFSGGRIVFGMDDAGVPVGLEDIVAARLTIENKINDSIRPKPVFHLEADMRKGILTLIVEEGMDKPYLYRGKAYRRSDTATVEVDRTELRRLVLEGTNQTFEGLAARNQDLMFHDLEERLSEKLGVKKVDLDVLRTLGLYQEEGGYNNAAALLADQNDFPGIDIAKFGSSIDIIEDRETLSGISVLQQLDGAITMYRRYYQQEVIRGMERETVEKVPETAFREAVVNALVHRQWDVTPHIHVEMFDDRIDIVSIGGLPHGLREEDYLRGGVSTLRNPVLAGVFYRLHYIEAFGTGVRRIRTAYAGCVRQPEFTVTENTVRIMLPNIMATAEAYTDAETKIRSYLEGKLSSSSEISQAVGFNKAKTIRTLTSLLEKKAVERTGNGRGTKYRLK